MHGLDEWNFIFMKIVSRLLFFFGWVIEAEKENSDPGNHGSFILCLHSNLSGWGKMPTAGNSGPQQREDDWLCAGQLSNLIPSLPYRKEIIIYPSLQSW